MLISSYRQQQQNHSFRCSKAPLSSGNPAKIHNNPGESKCYSRHLYLHYFTLVRNEITPAESQPDRLWNQHVASHTLSLYSSRPASLFCVTVFCSALWLVAWQLWPITCLTLCSQIQMFVLRTFRLSQASAARHLRTVSTQTLPTLTLFTKVTRKLHRTLCPDLVSHCWPRWSRIL